MSTPELDVARLKELLAKAWTHLAPGDWTHGHPTGWINAVSLKGGEAHIANIRGWGYLTGSGYGGLGLSDDEATAQQAAWADLIVAAVNALPALIAALETPRARVEGEADPDAWRKPPPHFNADPRWQRQPQSDAEWDAHKDEGERAFRSKRRLAFAGDLADPRAPPGMALVSRMDISTVLNRLAWLEARFENTKDTALPPRAEPVGEETKRLREALSFYANSWDWYPVGGQEPNGIDPGAPPEGYEADPNAALLADQGKRALAALQAPSSETVAASPALEAAIAEVEAAVPGVFWLVGKGRLTVAEPLYGAQLKFGADETIAQGEGDSAASALRNALAALRQPTRSGGAGE